MDAVLSYAGRVRQPLSQPIPVRTGGFGGAEGLTAYLRDHRVTHLVDATHPFAARISGNAVAAALATGLPLVALTRPQWTATDGDKWISVPDIDSAPVAIGTERKNVFLAIGRQEVPAFAAAPWHHYLLRVVDPPMEAFPLPDCEVVVARGPFDEASDKRLLRDHRIDVVVSKNSGGDGARAKIDAARALALPVVMIERPDLPERRVVATVDEVIDWIGHSGTDRGV